MRKSLEKNLGQRKTYTATFLKYDEKRGAMRGGCMKTPNAFYILKDIKNEEGKIVTDHMWFTTTDIIFRLKLQSGDTVQFMAFVKKYRKGYQGPNLGIQIVKPSKLDYRLTEPYNVVVLNRYAESKEK